MPEATQFYLFGGWEEFRGLTSFADTTRMIRCQKDNSWCKMDNSSAQRHFQKKKTHEPLTLPQMNGLCDVRTLWHEFQPQYHRLDLERQPSTWLNGKQVKRGSQSHSRVSFTWFQRGSYSLSYLFYPSYRTGKRWQERQSSRSLMIIVRYAGRNLRVPGAYRVLEASSKVRVSRSGANNLVRSAYHHLLPINIVSVTPRTESPDLLAVTERCK